MTKSEMIASDPETSRRMSRIRQSGTKPELILRKLLTAAGIRFRCNAKKLPGTPDLSNRRRRWAIFVHGCFWHGHDGCPHATLPKRNSSFLIEKMRANKARDAKKVGELEQLGFDVAVVWECEIDPKKATASLPVSARLNSLILHLVPPQKQEG